MTSIWCVGSIHIRVITSPKKKVCNFVGGEASPLLANLSLHYVFDKWMIRTFPQHPWARYADDGVVHCRTEREAQQLLEALRARCQECSLALHPEKTQIIYCHLNFAQNSRGSKPVK